jgi:hypothetical protein
MATLNSAYRPESTPRTHAEIRELAQQLVAGKITPQQYFAAVDRRAERLVHDEASHKR